MGPLQACARLNVLLHSLLFQSLNRINMPLQLETSQQPERLNKTKYRVFLNSPDNFLPPACFARSLQYGIAAGEATPEANFETSDPAVQICQTASPSAFDPATRGDCDASDYRQPPTAGSTAPSAPSSAVWTGEAAPPSPAGHSSDGSVV